MLNVQELTTRLSMMPDPALQQYAALHKDDPYVLALAVSESNRRRQIRAAQQGVAGAQPQPTVAEQEVAQMNAPAMPEQIGIGALPAPALAGMPAGGIVGEEEQAAPMAGGGLVAFAAGGDVERYQSNGLVQPQEARNPLAFLSPSDFFSGVSRVFREGIDPVAAEKRRREAEYARKAASYNLKTPAEETVGTPEFQAAQDALRKKAAAEGRVLPGDMPPAPAAPASPGIAGAPGASGAVAPGGLGDINAMLKSALAQQSYTDPAKEQVKKLGETLEKGAEGRLKSFNEYVTKTGDIYKAREERLAERGTEIGKQKDINMGLALLNAGFAIMSTPGGLATALGKGARVGTEQFASGLEKIRAAQDRLDDARDKLDELKVNRADMTFKERQGLQSEIDKAKAEAIKMGIEGTRMAAGVTEKRAAEIFGGQIKVGIAQLEQAGANARANVLPGDIRAAMLLGSGKSESEKLSSGIPKLMELKDHLTDAKIAELYGKHVADAKKDMSTPLSPEEFAKAIKAATGAYRPKVADVEATRAR